MARTIACQFCTSIQPFVWVWYPYCSKRCQNAARQEVLDRLLSD